MLNDWTANNGNPKARIILVAFRIANSIHRLPRPWRYIGYPYVAIYRFIVEWILGVEIPWKLKVGAGLRIHHGQSLVINDRAVIGENCILRHCTTIGVAHTSESFDGAAPTIGNSVDIGSNVVILGGIHIGDDAVIGAGSVVIRDVPAGAIVVGNPARVIRMKAPCSQEKDLESPDGT